jgi:hypothetical protein
MSTADGIPTLMENFLPSKATDWPLRSTAA